MARNRLPQSKARVSGAVVKNAGRFKDRATPKGARPVGSPYATMTAEEIVYWHELVGELPWLHSRHRVLLRMACVLSARMETGEVGVEAMKTLSALLSKLGATPVDETKVNHARDDEEDPTDEFFAPPARGLQ